MFRNTNRMPSSTMPVTTNGDHGKQSFRRKRRSPNPNKRASSFSFCFCAQILALVSVLVVLWVQHKGFHSIERKIHQLNKAASDPEQKTPGHLFGNLSRGEAISPPLPKNKKKPILHRPPANAKYQKQQKSEKAVNPLELSIPEDGSPGAFMGGRGPRPVAVDQPQEKDQISSSNEDDKSRGVSSEARGAGAAAAAAAAAAGPGRGRGRRPRAAVGVTVTADGSQKYADGAAVLAHGVRTACRDSEYDIDLFAIVHKNATQSQQWLSKLGYKVFVRDLPLQHHEIQGEYLKKRITKSGCCGMDELLKLHAYALTDYERVLALDMDSMVLRCPDDLFARPEDALYTYDFGMMPKQNRPSALQSALQAFHLVDADKFKPAVQGGFILVRPDIEVYKEYVEIFRVGDFRERGQWGGSGIGHFWGGVTIQGVVSYYYNYLHRGKGAEVDRCIYNNMADAPENGRCRETPLEQVKGVHFTVCRKPWDCPGPKEGHPQCQAFHREWRALRSQFESSLGLEPSDVCRGAGSKNYQLMDLTGLGVAFDSLEKHKNLNLLG